MSDEKTKDEENAPSPVEVASSARMASSPAPVNAFSRLSASTNLNAAPANWLLPHPSGADLLSGFRAAPRNTGFSSLWMASRFVQFVRAVDVMADADNIKKLLKLPYSRAPVSLVVHRVGKTLLIDDFDIHGFLLRTSEEEWKWLKRFFVETVFSSLEERQKALVRRKTTADAIQQRNLVSKFLFRSVMGKKEKGGDNEDEEDVVGRDAVVEGDGKEKIRSGDSADRIVPLLPPLPEPSIEARLPDAKSSKHEFARNLLWNFEDIRMLIGSDMPIFGDSEHPSVSLRLHNADKPINVLTGLDYWLDNLMCQVPEVLMCYHLDGIVQNYELVKTEDLPNMEGCKFSPRVVRDVAKNILSFLKSNAAKEGHTYWLFKGKDDDVAKLYDLTSLCSEVGSSATDDGNGAGSSQAGEFQNPFRTAVSMLLYKVARNILQSEGERLREGKTVRQLLVKCLHLLDEDKFPHIATSAHFMLSDLYVPDDINPASPDFGPSGDQSPPEASLFEDDMAADSTKLIDLQALRLPSQSAFREHPSQPSSLSMSTKERCFSALSHIAKGLKLLEFLVKRREETAEAEKKRQEQEERDNIRMAQPSQPIPMGYDDPSRRQVEVYSKRGDGDVDDSAGPVSVCRADSEQAAPAWHDHLKKVLLRKAFLVYVTFSEVSFADGKFGCALRCIKRALSCYSVVNALNGQGLDQSPADHGTDLVLSFAFGVAGDSLMAMVRSWDQKMVAYQEEYNSPTSDHDAELAEQVEATHVDESFHREAQIKLPRDTEEAMVLSRGCLRRGADLLGREGRGGSAERAAMLGRLGNVCNELASFYMNQLTNLVQQVKSCDDAGNPARRENLGIEPLQELRNQSKDLLEEGLDCFRAIADDANLALLFSNSGRLCRLFAFAYGEVVAGGDSVSKVALEQYREAVSYYERALVALKSKKKSPAVWDTVTWEYSTTLFTLGTQLQDFGVACLSLSRSEVQRQVTSYLSKALRYCDVDSPGPRQHLYQYRAATIHHRLASMHQSFLMAPEGEGGGRELTSSKRSQLRRLSEYHYEKAARTFLELEQYADFLRTQLHRVALAELGLEQQLGQAEGSGRARTKLLLLVFQLLTECLPCLSALPAEDPDTADQDVQGLLALLLARTQQNLLLLNKYLSGRSLSGKGGNKVSDIGWAKDLYAQSLKCRQKDADFTSNLVRLMESISSATKSLK